jgi:uncharacterized RDD family membrane protein YckC
MSEINFAPASQTIPVSNRLGSMILDHFVMTIICAIFFIPHFIASNTFSTTHEQSDFFSNNDPLFYVSLLGVALYLCKDSINGRSIGKRASKLQVVDISTGQAVSPIKCFIRNIFCIIWPVEAIVALINTNRRIGDRVAGTQVVPYIPPVVDEPKPDIRKIFLALVLSYGLLLLVILPSQKWSSSKINFIESSYNETESKTLEKLCNDSLGQYLSADARVYDKIEKKDLKYISIIYRLKRNYLDNDDNSAKLMNMTNHLVFSLHPENTFAGQAQYVYKEGSSTQTFIIRFGTPVSK